MAAIKKRPTIDMGNLRCEVKDCPIPLSRRNRGFTRQGLTNHTNKLHAGLDDHKAAAQVEYFEESASVEKIEVIDHGTPGDEVVMGDATSLVEDIKQLVSPNETSSVPVVLDERVVRMKARGGRLYVSMGTSPWEIMSVDKFCDNIRFAVRIS